MKHYSKEFKEEALKLSDEIGVKKAAQQLGEESRAAARHCVLHAGGLAQHTPKYTARENAECGGAIHPHPRARA